MINQHETSITEEDYQEALQCIGMRHELPSSLVEIALSQLKWQLDACAECGALLHEENVARTEDGAIHLNRDDKKQCQRCAISS